MTTELLERCAFCKHTRAIHCPGKYYEICQWTGCECKEFTNTLDRYEPLPSPVILSEQTMEQFIKTEREKAEHFARDMEASAMVGGKITNVQANDEGITVTATPPGADFSDEDVFPSFNDEQDAPATWEEEEAAEWWRTIPIAVNGEIVSYLKFPDEWTLDEAAQHITELQGAMYTDLGKAPVEYDAASKGMQSEEFARLIEEQIKRSSSLLVDKAREYATPGDRLHNFKVAASLQGGTPEQALGGFLSKHIVSVFDMINSGTYYPEAVWNEKITDSINYLLILRAMVEEV